MRVILVRIIIRLDPRGPTYMMVSGISKLTVSLLVPRDLRAGPPPITPAHGKCHEHGLTRVNKFSRSVNPFGYATILTLNQVA